MNQQTIYGTPLSVAVRAGNLDVVKLLVQQPNCKINMRLIIFLSFIDFMFLSVYLQCLHYVTIRCLYSVVGGQT